MSDGARIHCQGCCRLLSVEQSARALRPKGGPMYVTPLCDQCHEDIKNGSPIQRQGEKARCEDPGCKGSPHEVECPHCRQAVLLIHRLGSHPGGETCTTNWETGVFDHCKFHYGCLHEVDHRRYAEGALK